MKAGVFRISETASIALHTMVMLAADNKKVLSNKEVASALQVSEAHLYKVLERLIRRGLVKSVRGANGGFTLAKPGGRISLLQVYEAIEGKFETDLCLLDASTCHGNDCIFGGLLGKINGQVRAYLISTKLNELSTIFRSKENAA